MSLLTTDLAWRGSANMPENNSSTSGGAIDTACKVEVSSASLMNTLADTVNIVSSDAGDTTQTVTVTGRNAAGSIITEDFEMNGTTQVTGATTFASILKIVSDGAHDGTFTVTRATGGTTICTLETGITTLRKLFYDASSDVSGGSSRTFYEKIFLLNSDDTFAALGLLIKEQTDSEGQFTFAIEDAVNDNESIATRLSSAPTGITGDGFGSHSPGIAIPGSDLDPGDKIGVWVALTLPAGDAATKASYTLKTTMSTSP